MLPILYKYCKRGTVIRSDGWRAYRALHDRNSRSRVPVPALDDGSADFDSEGGLFFRAHQVVNHSRGFATADQVTTNPPVSQAPVSGLVHTNIIESLWRELKAFIHPRYRNMNDCPGKILEYLWRYENRGRIFEGIKRCFSEVSFLVSEAGPQDSGDEEVVEDVVDGNQDQEFQSVFFTAAAAGETDAARERRSLRDERQFQAWVERRRARDEAEGLVSGDDTDEEEEAVLPPTPRPTRTRASPVRWQRTPQGSTCCGLPASSQR